MSSFILIDEDGNRLKASKHTSLIEAWLIENRYWEKHPDATLKIIDEFNPRFGASVTADMVSKDFREIEDSYLLTYVD